MLAAGACEGVRRRGGGLPRARERAQGRQPKGLRESEGGRACGRLGDLDCGNGISELNGDYDACCMHALYA